MTEKAKAVVLLSGGLDSATCLAIAKSQGFSCYALSFDYGQRHSIELLAAKKVAETLGAEDSAVIDFNLRRFGGSALTDDIEVPKDKAPNPEEIPITYVPARNTIFLSFALGWAETLGAFDIFIGANALDYSGYPDCRPEYIKSFEEMANLATKVGVEGTGRIKVHAPLMEMTKSQIISAGYNLGVDYSMTHSCYDPDENGFACGLCESCRLRKQGFLEAGISDPTRYGSDS